MKKFLIKHGIVKTDQQANYILIAIIVLCLIYIFSQLGASSSNRNIDTFDESEEFMTDDMNVGGELDASLESNLTQ